MIESHRRLVRTIVFAALLCACAAPACAQDFIDLRHIAPVVGDASAGKDKAAACSACHGANGISAGSIFPNLAGQHAEYLYWQLVEFKRDARPESVMTSQVANLDDVTMRNLAAWFASLPPPSANASPDATSTNRGVLLYREGDPAHGTPPCQGCHGADARGHPWADKDASYRTYPALRGQHADYIAQRLKDFRAGKHLSSSSDRIMTAVAKTLDDDSIAAVATWLEMSR